MDISSLILIVGDGLNWFLVKEFLTTLGDKDYLEVFSFYKTLKSLIAQKENSIKHIYVIAHTYSNIVKFRPRDYKYTNVRDRLRGLTQRALIPQGLVELRIRVALYGLSGISLSRYIPECRHRLVIIITRNKKVGLRLARGKLLIKVGNINDKEAYSLLYIILEDKEILEDNISLLSSKLKHLLLALI
ncbi:unnamed protein product [Clonostachys solani]|uniref:Uncharacterized protein n=1 Tax=Clonostachys solani TaxID=160281 RepID=A0A9N9ZEF7_9HYPO|nr:unnamed protein product [Clonostachys solani]